jgi:hypothetical protein
MMLVVFLVDTNIICAAAKMLVRNRERNKQ